MTTRTDSLAPGASTAPRSRAVTRDARLDGVLLFVQAAQFMVVITLAASMAPAYDLAGGAISDLGVVPQTAALFNASLVLTGVLNLVVGTRLYGGVDRWSWVAFVLAGLGAIGAGLVPLDRGGWHGWFALVAFVAFNVEALAASRHLAVPMSAVGVVAGVTGLLFVVLMIIGDAGDPAIFGPIGHGGAERMIVYPVMLWLLGFAGYLMAGGAAVRGGGDDGGSRAA